MSDLQVIRDALPEGEAREAFERMARLLSDMADALAYVDEWRERVGIESPDALLARFRQLEERAG